MPRATSLDQLQIDHWKLRANRLAWEDEEIDCDAEIQDAAQQGEEDGRQAFTAFRDSQPKVKGYARGDSKQLEEVAADKEAFQRALEEFNNLPPSTRSGGPF